MIKKTAYGNAKLALLPLLPTLCVCGNNEYEGLETVAMLSFSSTSKTTNDGDVWGSVQFNLMYYHIFHRFRLKQKDQMVKAIGEICQK